MSVHYDSSGVVTPGLTKHLTADDAFVKRPIQRRNVYKGGDKRNRDSLRVHTIDQSDISDGQLIAKSAPGSGRTSPTDLLSFSLSTAPKAFTPSNMSNPPIEAKVVILGAQGQYICTANARISCVLFLIALITWIEQLSSLRYTISLLKNPKHFLLFL